MRLGSQAVRTGRGCWRPALSVIGKGAPTTKQSGPRAAMGTQTRLATAHCPLPQGPSSFSRAPEQSHLPPPGLTHLHSTHAWSPKAPLTEWWGQWRKPHWKPRDVPEGADLEELCWRGRPNFVRGWGPGTDSPRANSASPLQIPLTPLQPPSEPPASPSLSSAEGLTTSLPLGHCAGQREVGGLGTLV